MSGSIDISISLRQLVACFDDVRFASSAPARGSKHGEQLAVSLCAFNPEGFGFFFQGTSTTFFLKNFWYPAVREEGVTLYGFYLN